MEPCSSVCIAGRTLNLHYIGLNQKYLFQQFTLPTNKVLKTLQEEKQYIMTKQKPKVKAAVQMLSIGLKQRASQIFN
jgi:hypothetical protein